MSIVIDELKRISPDKVLELGAYQINLTSFSDNMDFNVENIDVDNLKNKTYIQDACKLPWDIKDKEYDAFIALQVFEHLGDSQSIVFDEVSRISKNAILSFPFEWKDNCDEIHYNITRDIIDKWTNYRKPEKEIIVEARLIRFYKF